jgi:hypothetical protein
MWADEVNHKFEVVPGFAVKPYPQYHVVPNNFLNEFGSREPSNAWVIGFQVSIDFAAFLELPRFVAC